MKTSDFTTSLLVDKTQKEVFDAVNSPQNWWPGDIAGRSEKINDEFTYRYKEFHYSKQRVVEMVPDQKVVWLVTESQLNFTEDVNEWTGTKIIFETSEEDGKTRLNFTHQGLYPGVECFDSCSGAWSQIIQQSLFSLITTGKGVQLILA
ncbi:MAG TPA: SRPBCC domain-containing protein [Pedobacter sp.]|uniref:SRPBCC family protein n=1 Tax=Pedobacter sp. TaxID=1411316 RepID=UPI002C9178B8|nr:SRPBCC domain-containing protein [Pedobacter sp.]HMI05143.1 SRPBCC domain-containing protein [Pedobacter sp.]